MPVRETFHAMAPKIYLTFDDGPYPSSARVLDVLRDQRVKATFFLCAKNMEQDAGQQYRLAKRMLDEGHSLGNHGYDHDPASKKAYLATTVQAVEKDFTDNIARFEELFKKNGARFPGFPVARLPGDGRFMPTFVAMITGQLHVPHVGWDFELSDNSRMSHVNVRDWQKVAGVAATSAAIPQQDAILLLHDLHWRGKEPCLGALLEKLKESRTIANLDPIPKGHRRIQYP